MYAPFDVKNESFELIGRSHGCACSLCQVTDLTPQQIQMVQSRRVSLLLALINWCIQQYQLDVCSVIMMGSRLEQALHNAELLYRQELQELIGKKRKSCGPYTPLNSLTYTSYTQGH